MRFEMFTKLEVELHINFFNLNESFLSICLHHTDKNVPRKWFWGAFFGTVCCRIAGALTPGPPPGLCPGPTVGLITPPPPQDNQLLQAIKYGHCILSVWQVPLSSMPSRQIWPTTLNSLKKGLREGQEFLLSSVEEFSH